MPTFLYALLIFALALIPRFSEAHEQYVLSPEDLSTAKSAGLRFLDILTPERLPFLFTAGLLAGLGLLALLLLERRFGWRVQSFLHQYSERSLLLLRVGTGIILMIGAWHRSFLGPDIPFSASLAFLSFFAGAALIFLPAWGASIGLFLYLIAFLVDWQAALNYLHYPSIFLFLLSLKRKRADWGPDLIRIAYGLALLYAAVSIKLLHPAATLAIIEKFQLAQFHWLFPSDPYLILAGAALTEMTIGIFLICGLLTRWMLLISLFYATLALLYLPEPAWPHLVLYLVSFYILLTPQRYSIDSLLRKQKTP